MSAMPESVAGNSHNSRAPKIGLLGYQSGTLRDSHLIDALCHSKLYRDYERTFSAATGLPLALRPVEFFGLPLHGKANENAFCAYLARGKSSCGRCLEMQARVVASARKRPRSVQCPFGLTETAVPIRLGERIIGFLCTGQVFTRSAHLRNCTSQNKLLLREAERKALRLLKQTRSIETAKYRAMIRLLIFFAKQLSSVSNQLLIEQKCGEPEVVLRARRFIAENKRGRLSLTSVARASGASMFHFCTLFHQTTGLSFRDYVARSRIEDARVLLCDRRRRVCEVASEAGFQSMTAFNRAFRRIVGESPSEYRAKLAAHAGHSVPLSFR